MAKNPIPEFKPLIVGVGGTLRKNSTSEKAVRTVLDFADKLGAETKLFAGPDIVFPFYDPAVTERDEKMTEFIEALRNAQGVVICSPSYHGIISGHLKNALDYTEDLRTDPKIYLGGRAIGCIGCGAGDQGANATLASLRSIAHALRGWPTSVGAAINTTEKTFDENGACVDQKTNSILKVMAEQIYKFARMRYLARAADPDWDYWVKTDEDIPSLYH